MQPARGRAAAAAALLLLALALAVAPAAAGCSAGDLPCICKEAGGWWETPPQPLLQTCKFKVQHQGKDRTANVYLPAGFDPWKSHPMWIHLHGVFWRAQGGIDKQVNGWPVEGADATALWDRIVGGKAQTEGGAIIVYPQSLGDPNKRQFFQNGYWSCSVDVCIDSWIDDVGFIDQLLYQLPGKFAADPNRIYLSGKSAGGVLVHAALCRSEAVATKVRVAVDILGGLPEPMAQACAPKGETSVLLIHGEQDEHLPFNRRVVLDYVPFLSKQDAASFWRSKFQMWKQETRSLGGGQYDCDVYTKQSGGDKEVVLCGIRNAGHTADIPYVGAPYDLAWSFLSSFK
ncbi:hypothetical protein Rsub_06029 [Raphidocelis subcapitata]|uniref:Uncharacterized protein n=1 Tax=Raphidocelis subcapitata TaxID=307507 RepID=A0A2V0P7Z4_9CHLO|nr:hypothetical protein Rsub_06029 [Raphidocelis subcapitata]|eukprot:GBF93297.1 hypothetical protein Rsub_06029 [Raphidocelis subcapitata]